MAAEANIDYAHFLILGGPGETLETVETTIAHSARLPGATLMGRIGMRVYPGTPLYDRLNASSGRESLPRLLKPFYYLAPPLTQEELMTRLRAAAQDMPNWIFDDPPPEYQRMAERLRAKGVVGPLWSYFSMMQRLGGLTASSPNRE